MIWSWSFFKVEIPWAHTGYVCEMWSCGYFSTFLALWIDTEASESVPIELLLLEDIILFIWGVELGFWFSSSRSDRGVFVPSCLTIVIFDLGVDFDEASDAAFAISISRILFCNVFNASKNSLDFISDNLKPYQIWQHGRCFPGDHGVKSARNSTFSKQKNTINIFKTFWIN